MPWHKLVERIGLYIIRRRCFLRLTQEALAIETFVDRAHLRKIERGTINTTLRILCKIARVLQITMYEMLVCVENNIDLIKTKPELISVNNFSRHLNGRESAARIFHKKRVGIAQNTAARTLSY